jgi:hypothetical protein
MDKSYQQQQQQEQLFYSGYQSPNMELPTSTSLVSTSTPTSTTTTMSSTTNPFSSLYQTNSLQNFDRKSNTFNDILLNQNTTSLGFDYSSLSCLRAPNSSFVPNLSETNELFNAAAAAAYNAVSVSFAGKLASEFKF